MILVQFYHRPVIGLPDLPLPFHKELGLRMKMAKQGRFGVFIHENVPQFPEKELQTCLGLSIGQFIRSCQSCLALFSQHLFWRQRMVSAITPIEP